MKNNKNIWQIPFLLLLIFGTIYIARTEGPLSKMKSSPNEGNDKSAWPANKIQRCEGAVFGTFYHITYKHSEDIQKGIDSVLARVNKSLSPFDSTSVISAVNNNVETKLDDMFTEVFMLSKQISNETSGAFDITVAPLVNLWGFGFKNSENIDKTNIEAILQDVGMNKVNLKDRKIIKESPKIMLDCSAIAKGYGVDAVSIFLEKNNISCYMVEIGGEVRLKGWNPKGENWKIGINKPIDDKLAENTEIEQVLQTTDISMATSGNYRNFYVKNGKKYAHTIDPRTGYPVQHSILSATVLTKECAIADAYATSFMVLGMEEAKKVLAKHKELMAFFIYTDDKGNMKHWHTENINKILK